MPSQKFWSASDAHPDRRRFLLKNRIEIRNSSSISSIPIPCLWRIDTRIKFTDAPELENGNEDMDEKDSGIAHIGILSRTVKA
jgi:hypothetical protein